MDRAGFGNEREVSHGRRTGTDTGAGRTCFQIVTGRYGEEFMSNKTYDTLKLIALLVLPIGTFVSTFFDIWGIGYAQQIQQTFIALDVLCGCVVTIANEMWKRGQHG